MNGWGWIGSQTEKTTLSNFVIVIYYLAKYLTYFVRRLSALISTSSTVRKNADMNMTDKLNEGAYDYLLR